MSNLNPTVPAVVAGDLADIEQRPGSRASTLNAAKRWQSWRRVVGLLLIGVTLFLWTASNFLASTIFADDTYSKPFLVTYVNSSFFIIPLLPIVAWKAYQDPRDLRRYWASCTKQLRGQYAPVRSDESADGSVYTDSPHARRRYEALNASEEMLLGDDLIASLGSDKRDSSITDTPVAKLSISETVKLALEFCFLWFIANYFIAACLKFTTVASSTILLSTSSVFTLIFGGFFGVERFTLRKLLAVFASLAGVILISSVDLSGSSSDDEHRGDFPEKSLRELAIGDALALLSAVLYGIYAVFLKRRIADESRVDMPIFFGIVGLWNVVLLWPGFLILHYTGAETFELPPTKWVTTIILCNSAASLISDLCWAYAVLLTSPIVVTIGLSMAIPLSLVGQILLNGQTTSLLYWLGAVVVVLSFIFVSEEEKGEEVGKMMPTDSELGGSTDAQHATSRNYSVPGDETNNGSVGVRAFAAPPNDNNPVDTSSRTTSVWGHGFPARKKKFNFSATADDFHMGEADFAGGSGGKSFTIGKQEMDEARAKFAEEQAAKALRDAEAHRANESLTTLEPRTATPWPVEDGEETPRARSPNRKAADRAEDTLRRDDDHERRATERWAS
ncbi:hypothetical protein LTR15_000960 [Elasticomyces elasticus]|nr:hypothetical protein LTR15_000960 [Elasticomyces elasticus]